MTNYQSSQDATKKVRNAHLEVIKLIQTRQALIWYRGPLFGEEHAVLQASTVAHTHTHTHQLQTYKHSATE